MPTSSTVTPQSNIHIERNYGAEIFCSIFILGIDETLSLPYNIVLLAQCADKHIAGWSSR